MEEASGPPIEVWPDNWPAVELFVDLDTQWRRAGMAGERTGLDYTALPAVLGIRAIPKKKWPSLFDDLRVMEVAVLDYLNEKRGVNGR